MFAGQSPPAGNADSASLRATLPSVRRRSRYLHWVMTYLYVILRPMRSPGARNHNYGLLGERTLGIEVTESALAAGCGLGNIDPQHDPFTRAACSAAAAALHCPLPPAGSTLATLRPDLDAIGAMAILALRQRLGEVPPAARARALRIDRHDRFVRGPWPGRRALPADARDAAHLLGSDTELASLIEDGLPLGAQVECMAEWLVNGTLPQGSAEKAPGRGGALAEALRRGPGLLPWLAVSDAAGGRVSIVEGSARDGLAAGYCLAPVVIARNPCFIGLGGERPRVKLTIAQYREGYADFGRLRDILARREAGWGGSTTLLGSPQGCSCALSLVEAEAAVAGCLTSP